MLSTLTTSLGSLALLAALLPAANGQTLTAETIQVLGNNSLFTRWRPTSHFIAPAGWLNDPCGAMYDPTRDTYHLLYQWHPNHVNWGNISWGHATSKDLITWYDVGPEPAWQNDNAQAIGTGPVGTYDGLGIFSGTAQPVNIHGMVDGTLLAFYTSVSYLPTNWRIPYYPGTETQSLAYSTDGGLNWQKYDGNPIIRTPPPGWNLTGWRDPFFLPWPEMDALLGQKSPHYYAVFGSGIKGVGPRIPFYSAPASDLTQWTFLGALWEPAANTSLGSVLETGLYGFNFEVSGFFSLYDAMGEIHYFVEMGAEGGNSSVRAINRWALWNEGTVSRRENGSAAFNPVSGGAADWGNLYALTSFNDTKNNRRVEWGWAPEDMGDFALTQQGFQGCMALPRERFVHVTKGVQDVNGELTQPGNFRVTRQADGTYTSYTLGVMPLNEVVRNITRRARKVKVNHRRGRCDRPRKLRSSSSNHFKLYAELTDVTGPAGFQIGVSPDGLEYTNIYFNPSNYTINVDRMHSSLINQFANFTNVGYFHPYTIAGTTEPLKMTVFLDGSLLEIYVNDRFSLTTRIYPSRADSTGFGLYVAQGASAEVKHLEAYDGLLNVWPDRPLNSSSPLVFDTPEETNNYTWWPGN